MKYPFAEWLPDLPDHDNPGATEALNVIPDYKSYRPFNGLATAAATLSARCRGAKAAFDNDGNPFNFAGTATTLEKLATDATWDDVTNSGGAYAVGAQENWRFTQWGEQVLATHIDDPIQEFTMGTSSLFADLDASAPQARYITTHKEDFVIVGNTYDTTDGNIPYRVRWCAIGDPTSWTVSAATQADYRDLSAANGWVQNVVGGKNFTVIFQEKAVSLMTYVGSPTVFQIDPVEGGRGCLAPGSVIAFGDDVYYLADNGFRVFNGIESRPIGAGKIDSTFFADFDTSYKYKVSVAIDPVNKLVMWSYPSVNAPTAGEPDKLIIYNWAAQRWAHVNLECEWLYTYRALGYSLDDLDSIGNLDALPYSLDSRFWMGNEEAIAAFDTSHSLSDFGGTPLAGVLETAELELNEGGRSWLSLLKVYIDGTHTVQIGTRELQSDSVTWSSAISANDFGEIECDQESRYHRVRVTTSGSFTHAQGIQFLEAYPTGSR